VALHGKEPLPEDLENTAVRGLSVPAMAPATAAPLIAAVGQFLRVLRGCGSRVGLCGELQGLLVRLGDLRETVVPFAEGSALP
jgi:hypothetical protein